MTAKHSDPEYRKNSRIIRQQVKRKRGVGTPVECWRCHTPIDAEQTYDVGHINPAAGHTLDNLAPEHRYRSGYCQGNRAAGGRQGQAVQQSRRTTSNGLPNW